MPHVAAICKWCGAEFHQRLRASRRSTGTCSLKCFWTLRRFERAQVEITFSRESPCDPETAPGIIDPLAELIARMASVKLTASPEVLGHHNGPILDAYGKD